MYSYSFFSSMSFEDFRKWFNQRFSLSFDGKFVGLKRATLERYDVLCMFMAKLVKVLNYSIDGYLSRVKVLSFRLKGHTIKLYDR